MFDDDFIERVENTHKNWTGEEWAPERTVERFPLFGPAKRIEALDQINAAVSNADTSNLRRYAELTSLQRDMDNLHQFLLKANR